jgi:MFS family permease
VTDSGGRPVRGTPDGVNSPDVTEPVDGALLADVGAESDRQSTFMSLRHPGTKPYFAGLTFSMVGTWMQSIGLSWLVAKKLGGDGRELALLSVAQFAPMLVFGAWAGAIADRVDKRRVMIVTQFFLLLSAFALAWLDFSGRATVMGVLALSVVAGVASAFDTPIRRALIGDLVPKSALPNAMALNTGVITSSRVLGMTLGGFVTKFAGTGWCFALNGASYLAMMFALTTLHSRAHRSKPASSDSGVLDAIRHVWRVPILRIAMIATAVAATFTFNFGLTFPLMIKHVFHREADALGWLLAFTSVGSFSGAMISARRKQPRLLLFLFGCALMGLSAIAVGAAPSFYLCALASVPMGLGGGLLMSQQTGLIAALTPSNMRGRVLALQSVVFLGSTPIGGPIIGWVSDRFGARWGFSVGGVAAVATALFGYAATARERSV